MSPKFPTYKLQRQAITDSEIQLGTRLRKYVKVCAIVTSVMWPMLAHNTQAVAGIILQTNNTWKATSVAPASGWEQLGFNDAGWASAKEVHTVTFSGAGYPPGGIPAIGISANSSAVAHVGVSTWVRKTFDLSGVAVAAKLSFFFDDDGELYLNGTPIFVDSNNRADNPLVNLDVSNYLVVGTNVLAARAFNGTQGHNLYAAGFLDVERIDPVVPAVPEPSSILIFTVAMVSVTSRIRVRLRR